MAEEITLPDESGAAADVQPPAVFALVIAWSGQASHPGRLFIVPPVPAEGLYIFGRGGALPNDPYPRLLPLEGRPGAQRNVDALRSPQVSRIQASVRLRRDGSLLITNLGRCRMQHNGVETPACRVSERDTLQFGRQLLLVCARRPAWHLASAPASHPFGEPDEDGLVGESDALWRLRKQIEFVAAQQEHVLVTGESGTGKELVASAIHRQSKRKRSAIVARNAATFPEALIDAELFGNTKNYPNVGMPERPGLFGQAHGSTLFLDEIAELPLTSQTHLLRVLDSGQYQRLGEATGRTSDVRIIGATNRPDLLRDDVAARFKLRIHCPGLNERRDDIPLLAASLLRAIALKNATALRFFPEGDARGEPRISLTLMRQLLCHSYSTHIRELGAKVWQALDSSPGDTLDAPQQQGTPDARSSGPPPNAKSGDATDADIVAPASLSRSDLLTALESDDWVVERPWRTLGLASRHVLTRLMSKHALRRS